MPDTTKRYPLTSAPASVDDFVSDDFADEPLHQDPAMDRYIKGMFAFQNQDFDSAKDYWEESLEINPNNLEAQNGLARLADKASPNLQKPPEEFGRGLQEYTKGNLTGAKRFWEQAARRNPKDITTQQTLDRMEMRGIP